MNTYKTCQGCPDRSITCHGACPGYQAREEEKQQRYARKALKAAGQPLHETYNRIVRRNERMAQLGQCTR